MKKLRTFLKRNLPIITTIGVIFGGIGLVWQLTKAPNPSTDSETNKNAEQNQIQGSNQELQFSISKGKQSTPSSQLAQAGKEAVVKENETPEKVINKNIQTSEQSTTPRKIIGKKITVSVGGEPPKDDPNEIVGESTTVHVPSSEVGKHDRIVGEEIKVIVGDPKEKK